MHDNRLLLVQHEKDSKTYWLLPGGGVGLGERLQDSLVREFTEELNLQVTVMDLLLVVETVSPQGEHILQPTFLVTAENIDDIHLGSDKRVVDYSFFRQDKINEIKEKGGETIALGIERLRKGDVSIEEGYDGEFGVISLTEKKAKAKASVKGKAKPKKDGMLF